MILSRARKYHLQQVQESMRPGRNARKAKRHFQRVAEIEIALKIRRELRDERKAS